MKTAGSPLCDGVPPVHGCMPSHFKSFHERFEEFEVDDVIFDDQDVDRRNGTIEKTGGGFGMFDEFLGPFVRSFGSRR